MKNKAVSFLLICLALPAIHSTMKAQSFNPNLATKLQTTLDSLVTLLTNTKGVSASVYCPGQGIWTGTSGLSYAGQPLTTDMQLGIASNSKLFVSVSMLKLAEANVLSLEDSLHEWIPAYANVDPNITIRQLLNHSSGIFDPFTGGSLLDSVEAHPTHLYTVPEVMSYVAAPLFAAGTSNSYSNINYILAGEIIKSATGFPVSKFIRDSILTPLQMDSTFYDLDEPVNGIVAHRWYNTVDFHDTSRVSLNSSGGASGSLFSTSRDMARWYSALMNGQVINEASFAEMVTFSATGNYGLGITKSTFFGNECWGHAGATLGYKSRMIYDPCMNAFVGGLSNSSPTAVDGITALLYEVLVDHLPQCGAILSGPTTVCRGQTSVTFSVTPIANATSYIWTLPSGATGVSATNTITVDFGMAAVSGVITVSGNNFYGSGAASTIDVIVEVVPTNVALNGYTLSADSTASAYQWVDCDNGFQSIAGETAQSFTATNSGNYAVIMTRGLCSDTSACTQVIIAGREAFTNQEITVFPNPFSNDLTIRNAGNEKIRFDLINAMGQVMMQGEVANEIQLETSGLSPGIYFVRFENGAVRKLVK